MRFFVTHTGFIKGRPPRYRHVGEMQVLMETPVEIRKVAAADAPVVYRLQQLGKEISDFRLIDGNFYRRSCQQKLKYARHGAISVERLQEETSIQVQDPMQLALVQQQWDRPAGNPRRGAPPS